MVVRTPTTQPRSEAAAVSPLRMIRFSQFIGVVGGILDVGVGILVLVGASMASASLGMAGAREYVGGILVIVLGGAVLATAGYLVVAPMAGKRRTIPGALMMLYGAVMLVVAAAMFADAFPMMQGSDLSGAAMVAVGVGMLYSGATMRKGGGKGPMGPQRARTG